MPVLSPIHPARRQSAAPVILVVALNPSVDAEWTVPEVVWEEKNVLTGERRWPGGKGINVARWLRHLGARPRLLLPLGGNTGAELAAGLRREGIALRVCPLREATRVNVIVSTRAQGQLRFNPPGPRLSTAEWRALLRAFDRELPRARSVVLAGSLPRGVPADGYAQLLRRARAAGVPVLLDCEGDALRCSIPEKPFLVKPNEHELRAWRGLAWRGVNASRAAALALARETGGWVFVSRGARTASLLRATPREILNAAPPRVQAINTVGAGDALLAAVARKVALNQPPEAWLEAGLAAGTAATRQPAGQLPPRGLLARLAGAVRVSRLQ